MLFINIFLLVIFTMLAIQSYAKGKTEDATAYCFLILAQTMTLSTYIAMTRTRR